MNNHIIISLYGVSSPKKLFMEGQTCRGGREGVVRTNSDLWRTNARSMPIGVSVCVCMCVCVCVCERGGGWEGGTFIKMLLPVIRII